LYIDRIPQDNFEVGELRIIKSIADPFNKIRQKMTDLFTALPSYVKVGASFTGILIVYRMGLSLGWSILTFAVVLTLWTGAGSAGLVHQVKMVSSPENYLLIIAILLLLFFTEALTKTGKMKRTIDALHAWIKNPALLLAGLPALVGLLPMPGGALFSAPLVDAADKEKRIDPAHKAAINYWFRHIWEYWWPLYPGIILAIKYSGVPAGLFFLIQMPFTVAASVAGYAFIMRKIPKSSVAAAIRSLDTHALAASLLPIGVLVGVSLAGSFALPFAGMNKTVANIAAMVGGLVLGLFLIFGSNGKAFRLSLAMFTKKNTLEMMVLVLGILVFSAALTVPISIGHTLVTGMRDEFLHMGIPILLVIAIIPFISGAVTGVAFGFVGASFPIVFALIGASPPLNVVLAATTFAYGCGYMGMILSPVHVCFVVTNEYFQVSMFKTYRYIILPAICVGIAGVLMSGSYYLLVK
jgi:uncharacterized protein